MFPMQSQINYDSLNATYLPFKFDIFLEDVDSLAALHIELEFDSNIFSIEQDSILKVNYLAIALIRSSYSIMT